MTATFLHHCSISILVAALAVSASAQTAAKPATGPAAAARAPIQVPFSPLAIQPVQSASTTSRPPMGVPEAVPPLLRAVNAPLPEPTSPPASTFHDSRYGISFHVPVAWNLTRKDADVSTFSLDARSAPASTRMRAVASISFNPHPTSTFSGALFYFSITPHATAMQCTNQASAQAPRRVSTANVGGVPFTHGYDEHGVICTEERDEVYTALRNNACYRFDLVINTYCGGDVSGVRDISQPELDSVRGRMQAILNSVQFDSN